MRTIGFEIALQRREEIKLKLKDSSNLRESDILIYEIDTLESILGRLADLKYVEKARAIEIAESNNDFKQAIRLRKQLTKFQDLEEDQYNDAVESAKRISTENDSFHKSKLIYRILSAAP